MIKLFVVKKFSSKETEKKLNNLQLCEVAQSGVLETQATSNLRVARKLCPTAFSGIVCLIFTKLVHSDGMK